MSSDDIPREEMDGRGQGKGSWLENKLADTLEQWGYRTRRGESLYGMEVDVLGRREDMRDEPTDYVVAECKDWSLNLIPEEVVIRLCLTAYISGAMPILCHTTKLNDRAWELAQRLDVRLLTVDQLESYDDLPPLTYYRPALNREPHRVGSDIQCLRSHLPPIITRRGLSDVDKAAFFNGGNGPCYVIDREGHQDYVKSLTSDFDFSTDL